MGFTGRAGSFLSITVDGYHIHTKDRIVLMGTFDRSDNQIGQIIIDNNVDKAQFFANAATTDTWGLDVVLANVSRPLMPAALPLRWLPTSTVC